jgi:hypothetical protein
VGVLQTGEANVKAQSAVCVINHHVVKMWSGSVAPHVLNLVTSCHITAKAQRQVQFLRVHCQFCQHYTVQDARFSQRFCRLWYDQLCHWAISTWRFEGATRQTTQRDVTEDWNFNLYYLGNIWLWKCPSKTTSIDGRKKQWSVIMQAVR